MKDEAFHRDCLVRKVQRCPSVMVWGCIGYAGPGKLHFVDGTLNAVHYQQVLQESLLPSIAALWPLGDLIFQQDGATCHTARTTGRWLQEHEIEVLPWPSSSPDLNPIETLWNRMKKILRSNRPRTVAEVKARLQTSFSALCAPP